MVSVRLAGTAPPRFLVRIENTPVLNDGRPANPPIPAITASQVSWTTRPATGTVRAH